jgi:hypothetical protein
MPLSKEFYLDEIRSKYPNSYNESLKDLPIKDLEDMLDFLEGALEKADGGSIGIEVFFGPKRGEYQTGGQAYDPRASIQDYAEAVAKVSGGTTAQKLQDIGRYTTGKLGLTQKHFDTIAAMKSDPQKFGINKQIDYAKLSGKDLVKGANPALQPFVALGQGLASPIYDYYQALQKYSDKGYQGDFELSKKGIVDFGKNLLRVGEEFAAQKPIQMAAGRTLGGLEAIQEGLSQFGTAAAADPSVLTRSQTSGGNLIRGFTSKQRSDGKFEYTGPDGQVYGPDTYADIAAGKYPKIYNPDKEKFRLGIYAANQVDPKTNLYDIDKMYDNYTKNFAASGGKGYFSSPDMLSRFKQFYADGGRVGLFMGGPPLEGTALSIYNSMSAYGFSDQEIADALAERGLYTPGGTTEETEIIASAPNIINQQTGGDGPPNDPPKDPYGGLGYSSANFGLGKGINKDAVMDYEADAYNQGRTFTGQLNKIGLGFFEALKNIPTPFNIIRKGIEFAKQKELEKKAQEEAIARDAARELQQRNIENKTGGYQFGYSPSSDFMSGGTQGKGGFDNTEAGIGAASAAMGSSKDGGLMGYGGKSGTPRGIATMFKKKR